VIALAGTSSKGGYVSGQSMTSLDLELSRAKCSKFDWYVVNVTALTNTESPFMVEVYTSSGRKYEGNSYRLLRLKLFRSSKGMFPIWNKKMGHVLYVRFSSKVSSWERLIDYASTALCSM